MLNPEAPPELVAAHWINAAAGADPSLSGLKGKVVLVGAFQMHCPGSARHLLPQLARLHAQLVQHGDRGGGPFELRLQVA